MPKNCRYSFWYCICHIFNQVRKMVPIDIWSMNDLPHSMSCEDGGKKDEDWWKCVNTVYEFNLNER